MGFFDDSFSKCKICEASSLHTDIFIIKDELYCRECAGWAESIIYTTEQNKKRVAECRKELRKTPDNAELLYEISSLLIPEALLREYYAPEVVIEVCSYLNKAISQNILEDSKTGISYLRLAVLQEGEPNRQIFNLIQGEVPIHRWKFTSKGKIHIKEAEKAFKRVLSYDRNNKDALINLRHIYIFLKLTDREAEIEVRLDTLKTQSTETENERSVSTVAKGTAFEVKVTKVLRLSDFDAELSLVGPDGGVDIRAIKKEPLTSGLYIIQCKNHEKPVGVEVIRDLFGAVQAENACKGLVFSKSGFTPNAIAWATGKNIGLFDGQQTDQLLNKAESKQKE